ncbi:MAG: hypothetical protein KH366_17495, partial [Clostridiaceae bacterium]|nr:hypothetical protein [Clostridiaceae bacterium]
KPSGQERTTAAGNYVAEATRRRRRIPRAGFFLAAVQTAGKLIKKAASNSLVCSFLYQFSHRMDIDAS